MDRVCFGVHMLESIEDGVLYDAYLKELPAYPFFKKELFPRTENQILMYFTFEKNDTLVGMMPLILRNILVDGLDTGHRDVVSPYGYSGPHFSEDLDEKTVAQFWQHMDLWYVSNNVVTEFIRFNINKNWDGYNGELRPTLTNVCGRILPEEEQWAKFKPKVRNNYRKAIKAGLKSVMFYENISNSVIEQFYDIYTDTMKRRNAAFDYFYNLEYFMDFIVKNPANCAIILVYKDDIPISTELLLLSHSKVYSFLGGTLGEHFDKRPNDFLKLRVLDWARENGFKHYFLGGGRSNFDQLYKYKKNFFPSDSDAIFYTGRKILNEEIYDYLSGKNKYCKECIITTFFPLYRCGRIC